VICDKYSCTKAAGAAATPDAKQPTSAHNQTKLPNITRRAFI
jgi:hypothetical protein